MQLLRTQVLNVVARKFAHPAFFLLQMSVYAPSRPAFNSGGYVTFESTCKALNPDNLLFTHKLDLDILRDAFLLLFCF